MQVSAGGRCESGGFMEPSQSASSWLSTLSDVERSIDFCIQALDRYELDYRAATLPIQHNSTPTEYILAEQTLSQWDEKLSQAAEAAKNVDVLLHEQEQVWSSWQEKYTVWKQSQEHSLQPVQE